MTSEILCDHCHQPGEVVCSEDVCICEMCALDAVDKFKALRFGAEIVEVLEGWDE